MEETLPHNQVIAARRFLAEEFIMHHLDAEPTPENVNYLAVCIGVLEDSNAHTLPLATNGLFKI